jgi:hypothetical protein
LLAEIGKINLSIFVRKTIAQQIGVMGNNGEHIKFGYDHPSACSNRGKKIRPCQFTLQSDKQISDDWRD